MSDNKETLLAEALLKMVKNATRYNTICEGVITDVSEAESKFVCDVQLVSSEGKPVLYNVPIRVVIGTQASEQDIPKINSHCLVCFRDGNIGRPQILFVDQLLKKLVKCDSFVFNDGELGGLVKVIELTEKLNNIENLVNDLITKYNAHTHNVTAVGSPTGPSLVQETQTLTPTQQSEIEDTKITH